MNEEYMTIDLIDMCRRILKKWKMVVIVAIIFALVFGLIGAILGNAEYNNKNKFLEENAGIDNFKNFKLDEIVVLEGYEKDVISEEGGLLLENLEMLDSSISQYNSFDEKIDDLKDYLSNSVLLKLDEEKLPKQVLKYNISLIGYEGYDATSVVGSIGEYINFNLLPNSEIEKIIEELGWNVTIKNFQGIIEKYMSGYTYNIIIYGHNKEEVEHISNRIKLLMSNEIEEAKNAFSMYNFSVKNVGDEYTEKPETVILNTKSSYLNSINDVISTGENISSNLPSAVSDLYKKLFNLWQLKEDDISKYNAKFQKDLINGKMIVIGGFLGAIIVMAYIIFKCIIKKSLKTVDEVKIMFNSNVLGVIDEKYDESIFYFIIKNIEVSLKAHDKKSCHLAGGMEEDVVNLRNDIKKGLAKIKINSSVATESIADNIENLAKEDAVVVFAKIDSSKYEDLAFEMETAKRLNKEVLGFVVVK